MCCIVSLLFTWPFNLFEYQTNVDKQLKLLNFCFCLFSFFVVVYNCLNDWSSSRSLNHFYIYVQRSFYSLSFAYFLFLFLFFFFFFFCLFLLFLTSNVTLTYKIIIITQGRTISIKYQG